MEKFCFSSENFINLLASTLEKGRLALVCLWGLPLVFTTLCVPLSAEAHGVFIFAWAEGPRICTQSYFSKTRKVMGGQVTMANAQEKILQNARTDDEGIVCFSPPDTPEDLTFTVNAGQGHKGEFLLPASELPSGNPGSTQKLEETSAGFSPPPADSLPVDLSVSTALGEVSTPTTPDALSFSQDALRAVIREELSRELHPIRRALAAQAHNETPSLRDVFGGLGWIFGLAATAALYYTRKKGG